MKLLILLFIFVPTLSHAAYYEIGFSGNYRKLNLPSETTNESFDSTISYTASLAYYFAEMAAAEVSYTDGQSERFVPSSVADSRTFYDFSLIGLDLIFTFAERKDPFIPYIKLGVAKFLSKDVTYEYTTHSTGSVSSAQVAAEKSIVPSLGFGLKFRVTQTMALKLGMEAWTSDSLDNDPQWDVAARAGISWFL